ncbi:PAS domain S-box protein, partial [bacterium]
MLAKSAIFDHSDVGTILVSPGHRVLQANRAFCGLVGLTGDEILQFNYEELFHPDHAVEEVAATQRLTCGESDIYPAQRQLIRRDGSPVWVLLSAALVRDDWQQPAYFIVQVQNIEASKQLENERAAQSAALRALLENAPDVISRLDTSTRVLYVNDAIEEITGVPAAQFFGRPLADIGLSPAFVAGFTAILREVAVTRQPLNKEYTGSDGVRHFYGRFVPEFDEQGDVISVMSVSRDITAMHRVRLELSAARRELEAANAELARSNRQLLELANHD